MVENNLDEPMKMIQKRKHSCDQLPLQSQMTKNTKRK